MPACPVVIFGVGIFIRLAKVRQNASFCTPPGRRGVSGLRMCVEGEPFIGTQMRPASSTDTASLVCAPASDIETPSSPTKNGFFGNSTPLPTTPISTEFDTGWAVLATVGYAFDSNWRLELEGGYRSNDIDNMRRANGGNATRMTLR